MCFEKLQQIFFNLLTFVLFSFVLKTNKVSYCPDVMLCSYSPLYQAHGLTALISPSLKKRLI
jgi:hypothetical protein